MLENPEVGWLVEPIRPSRSTNQPLPCGKITEVNTKFGWIKVYIFATEKFKMYDINAFGANESLRRITKEEWADRFLEMENLGITEYWRDDD